MEQGRPDLVYIADRVRTPGEVNGKSANLNHALSTKIYPPGTSISYNEVRAIFCSACGGLPCVPQGRNPNDFGSGSSSQ